MCRFYAFLANEPTIVKCALLHAPNALLHQSRCDRKGESHADGWGLAFYHDDLPEIVRRTEPAFEDDHFVATAERVHARTVIAHVRNATVGQRTITNTHPFDCGPWLFAHNGTVAALPRVAPRLREETLPELASLVRGTTDSELVFYWLLSRMHRAGQDLQTPTADAAGLGRLVAECVRQLAAWCESSQPERTTKLNFLLTDGQTLVATCFNHTLAWAERHGLHPCEVCGVPHVEHHRGTTYRSAIVASEPISHDLWHEVKNGSVVTVDAGIRVEVNSL